MKHACEISLDTPYFVTFAHRRQEKTIMKLVVDAETDKVLGASMCGPDGPEIMQVLFFVSLPCLMKFLVAATKAWMHDLLTQIELNNLSFILC